MLSSFFKDKLNVTILYIFTVATILLYHRLSIGKEVEVLYPMMIAIVFYSVFMLIELRTYILFSRALKLALKDTKISIPSYNAQQHLVAQVIARINSKHIQKISELEIDLKNWKLFISQWIHNLKTPATVMDLTIQKVKLEQCTKEAAIESMEVEKNRVVQSLDHILNIIRLEDFTKDYCPETVDLSIQLKEIINNSKSSFIFNGIYPKMEVAANTKVLTDKKWNKVLLEQIVSNAIKYSAAKKQNKAVSFRAEITGRTTTLYIEDTGVGIPSYDLGRVFEPFFTGENGRNYKNSTGIGLYVVKKIANKLGHGISLSSNIGMGTTVKISYLTKL